MRKKAKADDPSQAAANRMADVIARAQDGDESARPELKKILDEMPDLVRIIGGDLAEVAATSLIRAYAGKNLALIESLSLQMESMRRELAGDNPTPIERLLVERVVLCWLHVHHADCKFAQAGSTTIDMGDYYQRQQDRAHRRYLQAIKVLATVRRLALPIRVDLNVGGTIETKPAPQSARGLSRFTDLVSTN